MTNIQRAIESWRGQGLQLLPGLASFDIAIKFQDISSRIPSEVDALYGECSGMVKGQTDEQWFVLWPLKETVAEAVLHPRLPYVAFGDGFLAAYRFWMRIDERERAPVFIDDGSADHPLKAGCWFHRGGFWLLAARTS